MTWYEIKGSIRADLLARGLKEPRIRLNALDFLEKLLVNLFPEFLNNPKVALTIGKEALSTELAGLKKTGNLNGAEKSVLTQIFAQLADSSDHASIAPQRGDRRPLVAAIQRQTTDDLGGDIMNVKLGLPPVIGKSSTILILGTMPGDESIRLQQYYAHANNQFWKILSEVYGESVETEYSQRLAFLHAKQLALWDVLRSAHRVGSLDSAIRSEVANGFAGLLAIYTNLKTIAFNGGKAHTLFRRYVEKAHAAVATSSLRIVVLPSSSPTPGRNVLSFEEKVVRWRSLATL